MRNSEALIIFAKNPVKGKVKTRLAVVIGDEEAFNIYLKLLTIAHKNTKDLICKKFIFFTDFIDDTFFDNSYEIKIQSIGDLGLKMQNAFRFCFDAGYSKVVVIGTDCPELNSEIITEAFYLLNSNDFVIGPANDGGYYLFGMKEINVSVFTDIEWSTSNVLTKTIKKITESNSTFALLKELIDVDIKEDLDKVSDLLN